MNRTLLAVATGAGLALVPPAAARTAGNGNIANAVLASVLEICMKAVRGNYDLDDAAALAVFGLAPAPDEADLRARFPGIEAVRGRFAGGAVQLALVPGQPCKVQVIGTDRLKARDALLSELAGTGAESESDSGADHETRTYFFTDSTILVQTRQSANIVNIAVKRRES
ncbi:MAG: hypothetical protein V4574_00340 [Pseudomonadota bacterium]